MGTFEIIGDIANFAASISEDESNNALVAFSYQGKQKSVTCIVYTEGDVESPGQQFFVLLNAIDYNPKIRLLEIKEALQALGNYLEGE